MMPDKVCIGGHETIIKFHDRRMDERRADLNNWENVINIDNMIVPEMQEQSLCHEIIHGLLSKSGFGRILDRYNIDDDKASIEEQLCCSIENILWKFLKDNTNFFAKEEEDGLNR